MPLPIKIIFAPHAASLMQFKNVSGAPQASTQTSKPLPFVNSSQVVCKSHSLLQALFCKLKPALKHIGKSLRTGGGYCGGPEATPECGFLIGNGAPVHGHYRTYRRDHPLFRGEDRGEETGESPRHTDKKADLGHLVELHRCGRYPATRAETNGIAYMIVSYTVFFLSILRH